MESGFVEGEAEEDEEESYEDDFEDYEDDFEDDEVFYISWTIINILWTKFSWLLGTTDEVCLILLPKIFIYWTYFCSGQLGRCL